MAHYLVRARARDLPELKARLDAGEIREMRPFGSEMHRVLLDARLDGQWVTWEENCYCQPPLAQERAVLDIYFTDLTTEAVEPGQGWQQIEGLPGLWDAVL